MENGTGSYATIWLHVMYFNQNYKGDVSFFLNSFALKCYFFLDTISVKWPVMNNYV